jgi:hypothetical protein
MGASHERHNPSQPLPLLPATLRIAPDDEPSLRLIVQLAKNVFSVTTCLISLVERDRVWHQASLGFQDVKDSDHLDSFCVLTAFSNGITIGQSRERDVDARSPRKESGQFYAAVPLTLCDGNPVGTLTIVDSFRQDLSPDERQQLSDFGALASRVLELHSEITTPPPLTAPTNGAQLLSEKEAMERFVEIHKRTFTICAWSKKIRYYGQWMPLEEFLQNCLDVRFTHGLSEEVYSRLMEEMQSPISSP